MDNEDKAKEVRKAKAEGADFAQLFKATLMTIRTKENGGEITFDSANRTSEQVKKLGFALDVNGVSDVTTATGIYKPIAVSSTSSSNENRKNLLI